MEKVCAITFWVGFAWLAYVYAGYPACLWLLRPFRGFRSRAASIGLPGVSVLISARNEGKDIAWKVSETLGWDYPPDNLEIIVASDASEDRTEEILRAVRDPRFRWMRLEPRQGKNEALNRLAAMARGDLLLFTDANSHIEPHCLRKLVRHFADPAVGCVTGTEQTVRSEELGMATGTRAFLGYESLVNQLESGLGSVLVCDGSIFCIRRNLFHRLDPDLANDLELPLYAGAAGYAILFEPEAISWEKAASAPREEFRRKKRICGQGTLGAWRLRKQLRGLRAWQFFSRKVARWLGAAALALMLVGSFGAAAHPLYATLFGLQAAFYALAIAGWRIAIGKDAIRRGRALTLPFYFVAVNIAALAGVCSAVFGKRFSTWESPLHSRGSKTNAMQGASGGCAPEPPATARLEARNSSS